MTKLHALRLTVATWRFDVIKNCLAPIAFKASANTVIWTLFFSYSKCSKCLPLDFPYSLNLFLKLGTALFCWKFSNFLKCIALSRYDSYRGFKVGELRGHCFFLNHLQTVRMRHCWATRAVCTEPMHLAESADPSSSSRRVACSVV